jgi:hypothetical protein
MAVHIMHRLAVEFCTMFCRTLAARRHRPAVALAIVEAMIDVAIEITRPVVPRTGPYENTAREPLRAIVAIRSAAIRGALIVTIRTNRCDSDADRNLRSRVMSGSYQEARSNCRQTQIFKRFHKFTFVLRLREPAYASHANSILSTFDSNFFTFRSCP